MAEPESFYPFCRDHLIALAILVALGALIALFCKHLPDARKAWLGRLLALALASYVLTAYIQKGLAHELSWEYSLPLELCHWVLLAAAISLFRPNPLASEITYFWGLAGTLQATLTPEIGQGFPSWEFIQFFWGHGVILLAIMFFIAGQAFRPRPGSILRMLVGVNCYALVVGTIDAVTGWNYGYLCHKPLRPSLLDYLGPWPWYLMSLEFVGFASFWILDLPWKLLSRFKREIAHSSVQA